MESPEYTRHLTLTLLVVVWCFVHSAMISVSVTGYFKKILRDVFRYYRALYNLIAIGTFVPVVVFGYVVRTEVVFSWHGYWRIGQAMLLGGAGALFFLGLRHYDARQFLGIKQIREGTSSAALTESGRLDTSGILGITRHPWYLAAFFLFWARPLDVSAILVNLILSAYLLIGIQLEEKKLLREFGEHYLAYQRSVSMLIPIAWLKKKVVTLSGSPRDDSSD